MEILVLLVPLSVLLVLLIGAIFWWSVNSGQFDDLDGPAHRVVADDDTVVDTSGESPVMLTPVNPAPTGRR